MWLIVLFSPIICSFPPPLPGREDYASLSTALDWQFLPVTEVHFSTMGQAWLAMTSDRSQEVRVAHQSGSFKSPNMVQLLFSPYPRLVLLFQPASQNEDTGGAELRCSGVNMHPGKSWWGHWCVRVFCYFHITKQKLTSFNYISSTVSRCCNLQWVQRTDKDDKGLGISISEDHIRDLSTLTLKNGLGEGKQKERKDSIATTTYGKSDHLGKKEIIV